MRDWHLDAAFPADLFRSNWTCESTLFLLALFRYIDKANKPVLSMLPFGVSPAGAAAAAAMYFLPGLESPNLPHCRIALYPGHRFINDLCALSFSYRDLLKTTKVARVMGRGTFEIPSPIIHLQYRSNDIDQGASGCESIRFHWLWKCQRVWTRYKRIETQEVIPRNYFGRGDMAGAAVDLIETDDLDTVSAKLGPYDLLIYCPHYHPYGRSSREELRKELNLISRFRADRKFLVAKSPYSFWSREIEVYLGITGINFSPESKAESIPDKEFDIKIVNQLVTLDEALTLRDSIKNLKSYTDFDGNILWEIKVACKYLFSAYDPKHEGHLEEYITKLEDLFYRSGFREGSVEIDLISKIRQRACEDFYCKRAMLNSLLNGKLEEFEVWVSSTHGKRSISDIKNRFSLKFTERLVGRYAYAPLRSPEVRVILPSLDDQNDLNLLCYLRDGDIVILSAWDIALKEKCIESMWERSQRWRDFTSESLSIEKVVVRDDPLLSVADFIQKSVSSCNRARANIDGPSGEGHRYGWEEDDEFEVKSFPSFDRNDLITKSVNSVLCREVLIERRAGLFLKINSCAQVVDIKADIDIDEVREVSVEDLEVGQVLLIFRDSNRASIFDILMDQLEKSTEYAEEVKIVRLWKDKLRETYLRSCLTISDMQIAFDKEGIIVDQMTVRSWVLGPIMAPQRYKTFLVLIKILNIMEERSDDIFRAVKKIRIISRAIGRAIRRVIIKRSAPDDSQPLSSLMASAGIDLDDLMSAVDARAIIEILPQAMEISPANVGKLFQIG